MRGVKMAGLVLGGGAALYTAFRFIMYRVNIRGTSGDRGFLFELAPWAFATPPPLLPRQ